MKETSRVSIVIPAVSTSIENSTIPAGNPLILVGLTSINVAPSGRFFLTSEGVKNCSEILVPGGNGQITIAAITGEFGRTNF